MKPKDPIIIATRGSALALAQSHLVLAQCQAAFPGLAFEIKILKTTGDKLQTASLARENKTLPKGLFTKELEVALLEGLADMAVHSLKDLPTELPDGLKLGAVGKREDVRDVLIYRSARALEKLRSEVQKTELADSTPPFSDRRGFDSGIQVRGLPAGAVVATSSTRRKAQLLDHHPALTVVEIRGNVITRLQKLAEQEGLDATILALAGLHRLNFKITPNGRLEGDTVPDGLLATVLDLDVMLPCVGQGAIGIEIRAADERMEKICARLNDFNTMQCVTAERAFLSAMGGGCQSPVGAHAEITGEELTMRAISFIDGTVRRADAKRSIREPVELGRDLAVRLRPSGSNTSSTH